MLKVFLDRENNVSRIEEALEALRARGCDVDIVVEARRGKTLRKAFCSVTEDCDPVARLAEQLERLIDRTDRI